MADLGHLLKPSSLARIAVLYLVFMGLFATGVRAQDAGWTNWAFVTVSSAAVMTVATVGVIFALTIANRGGLSAWQASRMRTAGQPADALARYTEVLARNPASAEALTSRAELLDAAGQAVAARADLDHAIAVTPHVINFPDPVLYRAYVLRGRLREAAGDTMGALSDWAQAGRAAPGAPDPYILRGRAALERGDWLQGRNELAMGIRLITRALAQGRPTGGMSMGGRRGQPEGAERAAALNMRGLAYNLLGEHHRALSDLEQSLALQPDAWITHYNLGATYVNLGHVQQALTELREAIALNPGAAASARGSRSYAPLREDPEFRALAGVSS